MARARRGRRAHRLRLPHGDHRRQARSGRRDGGLRQGGHQLLQGLHGLQGRADGRRRAVPRRARADGQDRRPRDGALRERRRRRALPEGSHRGGNTDPKFHAWSRPPEVEGEATGRAIRLAEWTKRPLFVVHVTCEEAVREIQAARDRGLPIFGETCIQYLFLTVDELARPGFEGAKFVCSPPLREERNQEVLYRRSARARCRASAPTTARSTSRARRSSGSATSRRSRTASRRSSTGSRCCTTAPCAPAT